MNGSSGTCTVLYNQAGNTNYNAAPQLSDSTTAQKAEATVTLADLSATYNGLSHAATATTSPAGLSVGFTYDGNATAPTNAGSYAVVATITDNNYHGTASGTLTIAKATAAVTADPKTKVYGDADPTLTGTLSGFLAADNVTAAYTRTAGETVAGGPYTISATLSPAGVLSNYNITYNTALFTINAKAASVTPNAASKTYGDADPALSGTLSGFLTADNVTAAYTRTAGETVLGGPYTISATLSPAGVLSNYNITYNTANFTITAKSASVTPNVASKTYGDGDPVLTGSLSGFLAADNVTASYTRTAGETVLGGPYTISATLTPANKLSNYNITYNTALFAVIAKAASVTPNAASKIVGGVDPVLTGTLSGFLPGDNVTATYSRTLGEALGAYTISATLSPAGVLSNYTVTYNTASFSIYYGFAGLFDPYAVPAVRGFKAKSAIPLKWQFVNSSGVPVDSANAKPVVSLTYSSSCGDSYAAVELIEAAGNSGYQYDSVTKMWQFNWKTTATSAGCYNIYITQGNLEGLRSQVFPIQVVR